MTKWRSVSALLILGSAIACATPTNGGVLPGDVESGNSDGEGGAPLLGASGSSVGGAVGSVASSAGSSSAGTVAAAGAAMGGSSVGGGLAVAGGPSGVGGAHAGAGGASSAVFGGASGTSSSGGALAEAGAASDGPCANPKDASGGKSDNFGTKGAVCLRTQETFNTIGCSNFGGRTIKVNGMLATCDAKTTFPLPIDGYNYFDVSAGDVDFASFVWYTS